MTLKKNHLILDPWKEKRKSGNKKRIALALKLLTVQITNNRFKNLYTERVAN